MTTKKSTNSTSARSEEVQESIKPRIARFATKFGEDSGLVSSGLDMLLSKTSNPKIVMDSIEVLNMENNGHVWTPRMLPSINVLANHMDCRPGHPGEKALSTILDTAGKFKNVVNRNIFLRDMSFISMKTAKGDPTHTAKTLLSVTGNISTHLRHGSEDATARVVEAFAAAYSFDSPALRHSLIRTCTNHSDPRSLLRRD
jgi:hypothetical protein